MRSRVYGIMILTALFLSGCAGIKPAVQPPPPNVLKRVDNADDADKAKKTDQAAEAETAEPVEKAEPVAGTAGAEPSYDAPTPQDELELPTTAMPLGADSLEKTELAQAAADAMPPDLVDGWKVQVLALTDRKTVNGAYTDLKLRHKGLPMHLRYEEERYVLLAGNYGTKEEAEVLRDTLKTQGYPDAFVVEAPVEADSTAVTETPAESSEPEATAATTASGWRIQIMSLGSRTAAEQEKNKAEVTIGKPVYIAEVDGMFKLRVGDFTDEPAARLEAQRLGTLGFNGSFVVPETVNVSAEGASKE